MKGGFLRLSPDERGSLHSIAERLMARKSEMQALVEQVDAASQCAACRGACCVSGRYHFRGTDLLIYLATGEALFAPLFGNGACPYLAGDRCLMAPPYRPFNCITFNCELIEDLLPEGERVRFYRLEGEVRDLYRRIEELFPERSLSGALLDLPAPEAACPSGAHCVASQPDAPQASLSMQCNE